MERADRAGLAGFFASAPLVGPGVVQLDADAVQHMRVRRLDAGATVRVTDGAGRIGVGAIQAIGKRDATVLLAEVILEPPPPPIDLLVPVADRERMLWLAEKAVEFGIRRWQPVVWRRSLSVTPRGEGAAFGARLQARMIAALLQSGGAWLPEVAPGRSLAALAADPPAAERFLLDPGGVQLLAAPHGADAVAIAIGPEGGWEAGEHALLLAAAFRPVSVAAKVLRFETAGVAALALLHARWRAG